MSQLMEGKCLRCASFLSRPQNTCTIPRVAEVTGSEKSPPGGDTLHTQTLTARLPAGFVLIIIIRYICHVVVDTFCIDADKIHTNLNAILYTHVKVQSY